MFTNPTLHSCLDARLIAKRRLPGMIFDYIDGAAGEGYGEALNREAIRAIRLMPRVLNNVEHRSLSVDVFDKKSALPFGISPMGMCNLAGPGTDQAFAGLAAKHAIPLGVSTASSTSLEELGMAAKGNAWFQLYFSGNEDASNALITRAENAGYRTLILTVDVPEVGRRPRELRRGFKMPFKMGPRQVLDFALHPRWSLATLLQGRPQLANFGGEYGEFDRTSSRAGADWDLLKKIRDGWKGNLVVKGVLNVEDALKMRAMGVDAIQVSSHGGRQLDSAPTPIHALRSIRIAIGDDYPLFFDSGIRSGEDIIKAYAMGANFVFLGRPFSFAMAAAGAKGVAEMADVLATETSITLAQLGLSDINAVTHDVIVAD
ncbi:MAG: alpha-hydroxy acid oxidase [Hyphomicrobiales bacterium]